MNTDNPLTLFDGGIMYFRFPCFDTGPDLHYLFRYRISNIDITDDGGIKCYLEDMMPNRFQGGKWLEHPTEPVPRSYEPCMLTFRGRRLRFPLISFLSPTIAHLRIDLSADALIYKDSAEQPESNPFKDFSRCHE